MLYWQSHPPASVNSDLMDWLTDRGSMTKRLKSICDVFRVELTKEYVDTVDFACCEMLSIPHAEKVKHREVYLYCDNKPMIFAESLLPRSTLEVIRSLDMLNASPIGDILFSDPSTKRGPLEFKLLVQNDPLYKKAMRGMDVYQCDHQQARLWARRSIFTIQGKKLLIGEVFLFS